MSNIYIYNKLSIINTIDNIRSSLYSNLGNIGNPGMLNNSYNG